MVSCGLLLLLVGTLVQARGQAHVQLVAEARGLLKQVVETLQIMIAITCSVSFGKPLRCLMMQQLKSVHLLSSCWNPSIGALVHDQAQV
jgi:hypothetical protein